VADFYQTGVVSTLHRLRTFDQTRIENELRNFAADYRIALVLPTLYSELQGPALGPILDVLATVPYLNEIVITIDRADAQHGAQRPGMAQEPGRSRRSQVIALHDCDILTYSREMLGRLCYPTSSPNIDLEFCKAFYARVTDRMHGRVTRLLVTPLIRSLRSIVGQHPLLTYLDSFRYALAGEFSMRADLARVIRIPSDWGLEVGVLAEVYRNCALNRIAQVEICENYDHKHQPLSADDPSTGLLKMSIDITSCLLRTIASEGIEISVGRLKTLLAQYVRTAEDSIARYYADAMINGLEFDRHEEETAVTAFTKAIRIAGERFIEDPLGAPLIPNWNRITSAFPGFFGMLMEAVEEDNR